MSEQFKPIPIKSPAEHPWLFKLRCSVDLQLFTVTKYLRPALSRIQGAVLDVGAGESPWRCWLPKGTHYQGIDIHNSGQFGMTTQLKDVVYYDGTLMPFGDACFDTVMCIEVLEHAPVPDLMVSEISRVLKNKGKLILTVPWSARRHHIPHDYYRFTKECLINLMLANGFVNIEVMERGSDIGVIANKLIMLTLRLLKPKATIKSAGAIGLGIFCLPLSVVFLVAAHGCEYFGLGSREDPLGYFVTAVRSR